MARRATSARISADLEITRITITLSRFGSPVVEMSGTVAASNRKAAGASSFLVRTAHLGPKGEAFIEEMKADFAAKAGAQQQSDDEG